MSNTASRSLLDDEKWELERLTTCIRIARSVQKLHKLLRETETAIMASDDDLKDGRMAKDITAYNAAHPSEGEKDIKGITDVKVAMERYEESDEQAEEVFKVLWRKGNAIEVFDLKGIKEFKEARELVKEVKAKIENWGKRVKQVDEAVPAVAA